jgi:Icc-related predicted phosphoesterase
MKIQLTSDLHLEFLSPAQEVRLMESFQGRADALVVAGDFLPLKFLDQVRDAFMQLCQKYEYVIFVPGNHEYYGTSVKEANSLLGAIQNEFSNLYVPRNQVMRIGKVLFYGGTMWFPDLPGNQLLKPQLNDFEMIAGIEPYIYDQCLQFTDHFDSRVTEEMVVVSHHLPTYQSVPPRFQAERNIPTLNRFFVHDMEQSILEKQPRLWLHGHTHSPCDYTVGKTRVLCNPFGYPGELSQYNLNLIVEV